MSEIAKLPSTAAIIMHAQAKVATAEGEVRQYQSFAAVYTVGCDDDETAGHTALADIKRVADAADKERLALVEPVKRLTSEIDGMFREQIARPLMAVRQTIEGRLSVYAAEKMRKKREAEDAERRRLEAARAEQERIERERKAAEWRAEQERQRLAREEAERQRAAADKEAQAAWEADAPRREAEAKVRREAEEKAAAEFAEQQRVAREQEQAAALALAEQQRPIEVTATGAKGGYVTVRTARIVDPAKVPDVFWRPSLELIQMAVDEGARSIPGVEIDETVKVSNRRK